jgi:hypothetical protein
MVDWDDVLLLRALRLPEPGVRADGERAPETVWISVHEPGHAVEDDGTLGLLVTLKAENTYPALPVREDVDVVVRLGLTEPSAPALQAIRATCTGRSLLP